MKNVSFKTLGYGVVGFLGGVALIMILLLGSVSMVLLLGFFEEVDIIHLADWLVWTLLLVLYLGAAAVPAVIFAGLLLVDHPVRPDRSAYLGALVAVGISGLGVVWIWGNAVLGG